MDITRKQVRAAGVGMANLYDQEGRKIGTIDFGGRVRDEREAVVGSVHSAGGGEVYDGDQWLIGEVDRHGSVTNRSGTRVGSISGTTVYDGQGFRVGSVDAETTTTYVTGITEAHKAAAAMLLLLKKVR